MIIFLLDTHFLLIKAQYMSTLKVVMNRQTCTLSIDKRMLC